MQGAQLDNMPGSLGRGSPELYAELFRRHGQSIYAYCFSRTGDAAMAEDLASTTFLEAWRRRGDVRLTMDDSLPWLFGVATNVLRNQRRSLRRHHAALGRVPAAVGSEDSAEQVAERLDEARRMKQVFEALKQLPRADQEVLALCIWGELSYEETAQALDVPIGTVRSRLARARAKVERLSTQAEEATQ